MAIYKEKFHSFDALRFFSFFIVFLSHLPYTLFNNLDFLNVDGTIGVYFFFTLSGFLITYILLFEKTTSNEFNFKNFFARRALRIWPLYYLVLLFAFCSSYIISLLHLPSSNVGYEPNWFMSSFFLENYMVIYHNEYANVSPLPVLWSLCVEEHFYIIWGVLLYFIKTKKVHSHKSVCGKYMLRSFSTSPHKPNTTPPPARTRWGCRHAWPPSV